MPPKAFGCPRSLLRLRLDPLPTGKARSCGSGAKFYGSPHSLGDHPPTSQGTEVWAGGCLPQAGCSQAWGSEGITQRKLLSSLSSGWVEHLGSPEEQGTVVKARKRFSGARPEVKSFFWAHMFSSPDTDTCTPPTHLTLIPGCSALSEGERLDLGAMPRRRAKETLLATV